MNERLQPQFLCGHFGDPALYLSHLNRPDSILVDCGDLSHFSTRHLHKVSHLFLSHCHVDHVFAFDHLMRVHIGGEKTITVMGPPHTSDRIAGKLQGYTWNLHWEKNLEFIVIDLDVVRRQKQISHFRSMDGFQRSKQQTENWDPTSCIYDSGTYKVKTVMLNHRTPSMAYVFEENLRITVKKEELDQRGLMPGAWLNTLKTAVQNKKYNEVIEVPQNDTTQVSFRVEELMDWLLIIEPGQKIVYATDGAADEGNFQALLAIVAQADLFYAETCFLEEDRKLADQTKHFTARFIGQLAQAAGVKKLIPFHFSKRYLEKPDLVFSEIAKVYNGEVICL